MGREGLFDIVIEPGKSGEGRYRAKGKVKVKHQVVGGRKELGCVFVEKFR